MIRYKIKLVAFECDEEKGTAAVVVEGEEKIDFVNAIEGWNYFTARALRPFEKFLRDKLQENGFNRWTGIRGDTPTESELSAMDLYQSIRRGSLNGKENIL